MRRRQANYSRVKIHRSYRVEEVSVLLSVHKNTVRAWVRDGLPTCDRKRPILILGHELRAFLHSRRAKRKRPCQLGEIYCFRCRVPKFPAASMADYRPITNTLGNLTAICPDCECLMNQRVSVSKLRSLQGRLDITFPLALQRLSESHQPSVNSDLQRERQQ